MTLLNDQAVKGALQVLKDKGVELHEIELWLAVAAFQPTGVERLMEITKMVSPKAFVNRNNELIVEPKNNIYFRLEDVKNEMDLKCKVIAWLSRPSCKGVSHYWQKRILRIVNEFLGTSFTNDQIDHVYTYLGNDVNRSLCVRFIESGYDLTVLPQAK